MLRRLLRTLGLAIIVAILLLAAFLGRGHWQIRQLETPLPARETLESLLEAVDTPRRIRFVNTASQRVGDGRTLAYPAFLLEWDDGRMFVVDVGMHRDGALEFGPILERMTGADPIEPHGSVAEQLGRRASAIQGVAFTHLHMDHVAGLASVCGVGKRVSVYQTPWQSDYHNYTTADGRDLIHATECLNPSRLNGSGALYSVPGFPGLAAYAAGGHTPGSTIFFAAVDEKIWVLAGDISNDKESLIKNLPKPIAYSLFATPEHMSRLADLRVWLAELDRDPGISVLVSHDLAALYASDISPWRALSDPDP